VGRSPMKIDQGKCECVGKSPMKIDHLSSKNKGFEHTGFWFWLEGIGEKNHNLS